MSATFDIERVPCGVRGIRTPDTLLGYTRFPGVPLQPLEHHSVIAHFGCFAVQS